MDKFKEFVNENREEFEGYSSNFDESWDKISDRLDKKQYGHWMRIAASLIIICTASIYVYFQQRTPELPTMIVEAETYYSANINDMMTIIKASNKGIDSLILKDLETIDKEYQELKQELGDDINNEEVISAMIRTYEVRMQILEQVLKEIKDEDNEVHEVSI